MEQLRRWMDFLVSEVRQSARALARRPGFAAAAISALAVGIGANTAIFSVVNAVLLRPLPYPEPDRLVSIARTARGLRGPASIQKFVWWRDHARSLEKVCAYDFAGAGLNLVGGDAPEQVKGIRVTRQGKRNLGFLKVDQRRDGRGNPYFWIGFERLARVDVPAEGTDLWALASRYVSVTPLRLDRTDEAFSEALTATLK